MANASIDIAGLLSEIQQHVASLDIAAGASLAAQDRALIKLGLAASVTSLNTEAINSAIQECYVTGSTPRQIQEVVSVVSGLGVHSLMVTAASILAQAGQAGHEIDGPLSEAESMCWNARVAADPFWTAMEAELPGFLRALLRLSPAQFDAFFDYCAVPWKDGVVRARVKELLAMACDATPSHVFLPGFRLHLANAIKLGAERVAIAECIALAAAAPPHCGVLQP